MTQASDPRPKGALGQAHTWDPATAGAVLGTLCEFLPHSRNRVTAEPSQTDRHGIPAARFTHSRCADDHRQTAAAQAVMGDILRAAGASELMTVERYAHLVGGCRMGTSPQHAVVDAELRSSSVPNLLVTDGSVLPTQGSAKPALTIMALADLAAGHLTAGARGGLRAPARRGAR